MSDVIVVKQDNVTTVVSAGVQGPQGPQGANGDKTYTQTFSNLSTIVVTHNLGKYPAITLMDSAGDEFHAEVVHNSVNQATVNLSAPTSGVLSCN